MRGDARRSEAMQGEVKRGDSRRWEAKQSEAMRRNARQGNAMRGDARQGNAMRGDARRSDAIRGEAMRGEERLLCALWGGNKTEVLCLAVTAYSSSMIDWTDPALAYQYHTGPATDLFKNPLLELIVRFG